MKLRFALASLLLAALSTPHPAAAEGMILRYHLDIDAKPVSPAAKPVQRSETYAAGLFAQTMEVHDGGTIRAYDFSARRVNIADTEKKTLSSFGLYAVPVASLQRRNTELRRLSQGDKSLDKVDIDMALGADANAMTGKDIQTSLANGQMVFSAGGRNLASFSLSDTPVPPALQASYAHFLIYETSLHPLIRRQLAEAGKFFQTLTYTTRDSSAVTQVTLTLVNAEKTAQADAVVPPGLAPAWGGDMQLDGAIRKSLGPAPTLAALEQKIDGYTAQKDYMHALFAAAELSLTLGPAALDKSASGQKALQAVRADPAAGPVLAAINTPPRTTDQFKAAMAKLGEAEKAAPDERTLIAYYRANLTRGVLENPQRKPNPTETTVLQNALKDIAAAIEANPWLAGAYCDLGTAYYHQGQVQQAAILWEQAQRLAPTYPTLRMVGEIQAQTLKDFPEYF
jgi:hypothetical protein